MGMFCIICEQTRCVYTRTARTTFQENCSPDIQRNIINLMAQIGVTKSQKLRLSGVAQTKAKFENSNAKVHTRKQFLLKNTLPKLSRNLLASV